MCIRDRDQKAKETAVFKFEGKEWDEEVDAENGNFDYLMGADLDLDHFDVITELTRWGKWFIETTDIDGFRFDAVKHMKFSFYQNWLDSMRRDAKEELFSVGEYWNADIGALKNYIDTTKGALSLFDVPLHYRFVDAANSGGAFDMRTIFDGTLTQDNPTRSVTFVDNHDTQPGQALESWVPDWFKPLAYALILLRQDGDVYKRQHAPCARTRGWSIIRTHTFITIIHGPVRTARGACSVSYTHLITHISYFLPCSSRVSVYRKRSCCPST